MRGTNTKTAALRLASGWVAFCLLLIAVGCAGRSVWSSPPEPPREDQIRTLEFDDVHAAAAFLSMPGDIQIFRLGRTMVARSFKQLALYPAGLIDLLAFHDPFTTYFHVTIITGIEGGVRPRTIGYTPILFSYGRDEYLDAHGYAVQRVNGFPAAQERALARAARGGYWMTGACGDYVAWCYDERIYSWWNRIPCFQRVFVHLYPPEAIQTGDRFDDSPQTARVCEIIDGKFARPEFVPVRQLAAWTAAGIRSAHPAIREHGEAVRRRLIDESVLDSDGSIIVPYVKLRVRPAASPPPPLPPDPASPSQ